MDEKCKTRQEKKGFGKFYGKKGKEIYTQKHIRIQEQIHANNVNNKVDDGNTTPDREEKNKHTKSKKSKK